MNREERLDLQLKKIHDLLEEKEGIRCTCND